MPTLNRRSASTKKIKRGLKNKPPGSLSGAVACFYFLAFLSGSAALIYELTWAKMLSLTFGSTTLAAAAVIAAFMGGMGLGARAYDLVLRRSRRPILIYVCLELGIALTTALLTSTFYALPKLFAGLLGGLDPGLSLVLTRTVIVFLMLVLPAALMGATFPALCTVMIRTKQNLDRRLGLIYGINTLGGAVGVLLAGLVLIERFGLTGSVVVANAINVFVALAAFALIRSPLGIGDARSTPVQQAIIKTGLSRTVTGTVLFVSGFATLSYEILWFRALRYFVGNSTYALSTILVVFLLGLGLGSLLLRFVAKRKNPELSLGYCQVGAATLALLAMACLWAVLAIPSLREATSIFSNTVRQKPWWLRLIVDGAVATIAMLPATMAMGLSFPLASRLFLGDVRKLGSRIGTAYLLANMGSILGAIMAAILLLPRFGTGGGTKIVAAANLALGLFVMAHCRPLSWRRLAPVGGMAGIAVALVVILPRHLPLHGEELQDVKSVRLFVEEGDVGTVQVLADPDRPARKAMTVDGYKIGWSKAFEGSPFYRKQVILAHLPKILDTRVRRTLNVGLGSAATLQALASYADIETLDCVEINQSVVNGAELFEASAVLKDPRVHLVVDDAIHYLLRTEHQYDAIISDGKQHPFFAGNAALLCKEFYEYALEDLSEIGLFIQWMPLGTLAFDQKVNLNTLCQVFPYVNVFFFPREAVLTIASRKPLSGRPGMTDDLFITSGAKAALAPYQLDSLAAIRAHWVAGKSQLAPLVADAPVSTWNHLLLDFTAYAADRELWGRSQADNLKLLLTAERAPPVGVSFDPGDPAFVQSTKLIRRACAAFVVGNMALAKSFADQAVAANPKDAAAGLVARGIPMQR